MFFFKFAISYENAFRFKLTRFFLNGLSALYRSPTTGSEILILPEFYSETGSYYVYCALVIHS